MPACTAASVVHAGIAYVPVTDIPPIKICLAWKSGALSPLVAAFVDAVKQAHEPSLRQASI